MEFMMSYKVKCPTCPREFWFRNQDYNEVVRALFHINYCHFERLQLPLLWTPSVADGGTFQELVQEWDQDASLHPSR